MNDNIYNYNQCTVNNYNIHINNCPKLDDNMSENGKDKLYPKNNPLKKKKKLNKLTKVIINNIIMIFVILSILTMAFVVKNRYIYILCVIADLILSATYTIVQISAIDKYKRFIQKHFNTSFKKVVAFILSILTMVTPTAYAKFGLDWSELTNPPNIKLLFNFDNPRSIDSDITKTIDEIINSLNEISYDSKFFPKDELKIDLSKNIDSFILIEDIIYDYKDGSEKVEIPYRVIKNKIFEPEGLYDSILEDPNKRINTGIQYIDSLQGILSLAIKLSNLMEEQGNHYDYDLHRLLALLYIDVSDYYTRNKEFDEAEKNAIEGTKQIWKAIKYAKYNNEKKNKIIDLLNIAFKLYDRLSDANKELGNYIANSDENKHKEFSIMRNSIELLLDDNQIDKIKY